MLFLITLGIILLFINSTVGAIYFSGILFAVTIGLIIKEGKHKENKRTKRVGRTKEVSMSNKLKELCESDPKKFWVYFSCVIIGIVTVILCGVVIAVADTTPCNHEYAIVEEIAPTYTE